MFLYILSSILEATCITGTTNCLRCLEDTGCFFCLDDSSCYTTNTTFECKNKEATRTKRCIEELGGDAKDSVRYAIGFSILGASIIIDVAVRICNRRSKDEYAHL
ncbi:hypothetical protein GPJ56_003232 [Histomonas meleagridis]|uniref:uncharacterized protein n=1 Tax=Histomonas meleagridis TaxID=135588 RepID=UPI00355A36C6|nr:hypothetical protein GPJ56_003232 [Histomonas meleagridis]KAH0802398.1 hypothetical protein GO595_004776 [Histomonas meleagridis]